MSKPGMGDVLTGTIGSLASNNSISIEKINNSIPKVPNEALPNNLKWKNDIFSVSRLSNKKGVLKNQKSFKKEYVLTQIILSKPLGAIINNNLYPIGSKIGPYTVSKISENTVVLSGKRKSIVLELEIDEEDHSMFNASILTLSNGETLEVDVIELMDNLVDNLDESAIKLWNEFKEKI